MNNPTDSSLSITPAKLPNGGGAISSMNATPGQAGPMGGATFSLPLPVSPGRTHAPSDLALAYQSTSGNSAFGMGWQLPLLSIRCRTNRGVPKYGEEVEFEGPDGEVMSPERDNEGNIVVQSLSQFGDKTVGEHQVVRYIPRVESGFDRIEQWTSVDTPETPFWLISSADGSVHCLGKTALGRTQYQQTDTLCIAEWYIEESVFPNGEHYRYRYKTENSENVESNDVESQREYGALSHLTHIFYGNVTPESHLYAWDESWPSEPEGWHFSLVLDYGERTLAEDQVPGWNEESTWLSRKDAYSNYVYGFETRTHRLCRQVLMFHHFANELNQAATLCQRLLFQYDETAVMTQLVSAQLWSYGLEGEVEARPALQLRYSEYNPTPSSEAWTLLTAMPGMDDAPDYQLVDLYGEGIAGVLYQTNKSWRYAPSIRDESGGPDAVTFGPWEEVLQIPAMQNGQQALMDVTGNGCLDWVVTQPGMNGYFSLDDQHQWKTFVPFSALPSEWASGKGMLADIAGGGLTDFALVGPNSVRFFPNYREGFSASQTVIRSGDMQTIPVFGRDARKMVVFSDVLGSGQSHLVEVSQEAIVCWPNLGHGHFGNALSFSWESPDDFDPNRLYLVDLDGSGANDLVYVYEDRFSVYHNLSGNGFSAPVDFLWPDGVTVDALCRVSFADMQGLGGPSLLLSIPHMTPTHYRFDFASEKPYLLVGCNNQCGADSALVYRSSAQEWLDEKQAQSKNTKSTRTPKKKLPFPLYVLKQTKQLDEVTGNRLGQQYCYRQGVYDGFEREFRGFGYVETLDTLEVAPGADTAFHTPPLKMCRWYHTGQSDQEWAIEPWAADNDAIELGETRFTQWEAGEDSLRQPSSNEAWWMYRSLKGQVLREESYGLDGDEAETTPYEVRFYRYQVRCLQPDVTDSEPGAVGNRAPVVYSSRLESVTYQYERVTNEPLCLHEVTMSVDEYGVVTHYVTANYPRRPSIDQISHRWELPPEDLQDEQQYLLRLTEQQAQVEHTTDIGVWLLGLPIAHRQNVLVYEATHLPIDGLSFEVLSEEAGLIGPNAARVLASQQTYHYIKDSDETDKYSYPPRLAFQEVSALEIADLEAFEGVMTSEETTQALINAGYQLRPRVLTTDGEETGEPVWVIQQNLTGYAGATGFHHPISQQATRLNGMTSFTYDSYWLAIERETNALGQESHLVMNYRHLVPTMFTDINGNSQELAFSALSRPIVHSFWGTENGERVGFQPLSATTEGKEGSSHITERGQIRESINGYSVKQVLSTGMPWAQRFGYDEFSWQQPESERLPVHQLSFIADNYPDAEDQKVGVVFVYSDGFGRVLQTVSLVEPGLAYQRLESGELAVDEVGGLIEMQASERWLVSGRIEYDNKGQTVRQYHPYYVDDWRYVADTQMRTVGYADTYFYDALGRVTTVETAQGYLKRTHYSPWFTVNEDENDTLWEVSQHI